MALPVGVTRLGSFQGKKGEKGATGTLDFLDVVSVPADAHATARMHSDGRGTGAEVTIPRGLPGVNAVENDEAVATYVGADASKTQVALDRRYGAVMLASAYGVVGDGVADDAPALQELATTAAAFGVRVVMAPGSVLRMQSALLVPSGSHIDGNGSTLISALPSPSGRCVQVIGVSDVLIQGLTIDGAKASFVDATEQRHNVLISGSSRVTIRDLRSKNAKGDGIYVGDDVHGHSEDVVFDRVICDGNHRNGLSITAVDGFVATACAFLNTSGTTPQTGVDIEPNTDDTLIRGIRFVGCMMVGNANEGLNVSFRANATVTQAGGEFIGCTIAGNGRHGVYLNNGSGIDFTSCVIERNAQHGVWVSTSTGGYSKDVEFSAGKIQGNGGRGILIQHGFRNWSLVGVRILDNIGIGVDVSPIVASVGFTMIGCTSGNRPSSTGQTHGLRTGTLVSSATLVGNRFPGNTSATASLADDQATRYYAGESARGSVTGAKGGNAALTSLINVLAARGIITDSTT